MVSFKNQIKKANKEYRIYKKSLLKRQGTKRITKLERIEESRYKQLKSRAKLEKLTLSKKLDEVIDFYFISN